MERVFTTKLECISSNAARLI